MNLSTLTEKEIYEAIEVMQNGIAIKPNGDEAKNLQVSIDRAFAELDRRTKEKAEKKSESQPSGKTGQLEQQSQKRLPTKEELQAWQRGMESDAKKESKEVDELIKWVENSPIEPITDEEWEAYQEWKKIPKEEKVKQHKAFVAEMDAKHLRTVKAPAFVTPEELINVELEDSKGNKQVKTFSKAQVRALARKYFSNVHESWLGKDRKMGVGFKNLLAYVVAWKEFDGAFPVLRDVLPDYDRYNKGGENKEASEAFKVAQELYKKIVEILNDK